MQVSVELRFPPALERKDVARTRAYTFFVDVNEFGDCRHSNFGVSNAVQNLLQVLRDEMSLEVPS